MSHLGHCLTTQANEKAQGSSCISQVPYGTRKGADFSLYSEEKGQLTEGGITHHSLV